MNAAVLIPAYQPEMVLKDLVEKMLSYGCSVVVVDDGSGVPYQELFRQLEELCVVLHHDVNLGKGEAIRTGLCYIEKNITECFVIGIMDADGQHIPEDMLRVLACANMHPGAFVLGCRDINKMPFRSRIGNSLTRKVFYHLYHRKLSDTQTGMRAFSREFIPDLISAFCNYRMNCRLVFHEKEKASTAWQYFLLASGILIMNNFVLTAYTQLLRIPVYPAKLMTEITLFIFSWLVQSTLIFRKKMKMQPQISKKAEDA